MEKNEAQKKMEEKMRRDIHTLLRDKQRNKERQKGIFSGASHPPRAQPSVSIYQYGNQGEGLFPAEIWAIATVYGGLAGMMHESTRALLWELGEGETCLFEGVVQRASLGVMC